MVTPAPGKSARLPFWKGDGPGRPAELGEAIGVFMRETDVGVDGGGAAERLQGLGLGGNASANLLNLLAEQRAATGALPTDRTLIVERCRNELAGWRIMLHSPYGRRVHAPWCLVPLSNGIRYATLRREELWDTYSTLAPERLRKCVERYKIVKKA